jgi:hypothetical protein
MNKIGVNVSIDVKAIDKARLVDHTNGKIYLNMTVFIDPSSPDNFGQHGMVTQDVSKEERAKDVKGPILGNVKVFWTDNQANQAPQQQKSTPQPPIEDFDSIPF